MILPRYYCKMCGKFKNRFQVKQVLIHPYLYNYECKWCHTMNIELTKSFLEDILFKISSEGKEK